MRTTRTHHNDLIRQEFSKQAEAYAATASISDAERIARLVQVMNPSPDDRVLEVATGPGYIAIALGSVCEEVVGVDITTAVLQIAERTRHERGVANVRFEVADVNDLPFRDAEFDAVVCRFAFHHFLEPAHVLGEMVRVCRPHGAVVVEDLIVSEITARGAYQNEFERLRDPSHTEALPLSTLLRQFAASNLEIDCVLTGCLTPMVERWLANAQVSHEAAAKARQMIEQDQQRDLSGARPYRNEKDELCFVQRTAIVRGYKVGSR